MRKKIFRAVLGSLAFCSVGVLAQGWVVEPRQLLPPEGASKAVQTAIAQSGQPDMRRRLSVPRTEDEWRQLIAARSVLPAGYLDQLGAQLKVTISRDTIAGVKVHRVQPTSVAPQNLDRLFIYLHGGAYVFGGGDAAVREGAVIAAMTGLSVISVDYRMPPDHPSPAAVQDVLVVYRELLKKQSSAAIAMGGTSAGGGLTLAAVHTFKSHGLALPGALYLGTPWADLTDTSDSLHTNEGVDRMLLTYEGVLQACALLYAGGTDLRNPQISPVYGDFSDFPPTYLVSGTRDMLLSDTVRVHRKMRIAGVTADLNVYEGLSHAEFATLVGAPEWQQVYGELAAFLQTHLDRSTPVKEAVNG